MPKQISKVVWLINKFKKKQKQKKNRNFSVI